MVGAVKVNAAASGVFEMAVIELSTGLRSTVSVVVALPAAYVAVAGVEAVMVVEPCPAMVTRPVVALIVATEVFELAYEIAPSLLVVGADSVNAASL